jgi:hypothetical protein
VPTGEHAIIFTYHVPGLAAGIVLSLLSLLAIAACVVLRRRRQKKEAQTHED